MRYPRPKSTCQYCGGSNLRVKQWQRSGMWFVSCQECRATGPSAMTPEEACQRFDRRVNARVQEEFSFI